MKLTTRTEVALTSLAVGALTLAYPSVVQAAENESQVRERPANSQLPAPDVRHQLSLRGYRAQIGKAFVKLGSNLRVGLRTEVSVISVAVDHKRAAVQVRF